MYQDAFGLRDSPFGLTPDPRYLFLTDAHKEAIASVTYGLQERKGFVLILGEVGTGKTTIIRHILGRLGPDTKAAFVFNPAIGFEELLRVVLRELEVPCRSRLRTEMVETLHRFLLDEAVAGRVVALIIDEAQHLSSTVLEELRMLSNLETTRSKLLQIILVGQPELGAKLARPELRQVRQRVGLVAELRPLSRSETRDYIRHRLEVAGGDQRAIFTRRALRLIHRGSAGIPRLINIACDKAMILAYGAGRRRVNRGLVAAALEDWTIFDRRAVSKVGARSDRRDVRSRFRKQPKGRRFARIAAAVLLPLIGAGALVLTIPRTAELLRVQTPAGQPAAPAASAPAPTPAPTALAQPPAAAVPDRPQASVPAAPQAATSSVSAQQPLVPPDTTSLPTPVPSSPLEITMPPAPARPAVPLVIPGSKEVTVRQGDAAPVRVGP